MVVIHIFSSSLNQRSKFSLINIHNLIPVVPQLQGEVDVLHTAKVRHDWYGGGKLDLKVQQGDSVEIIRVKNNPGGKWLARSRNGNCESILQSRKSFLKELDNFVLSHTWNCHRRSLAYHPDVPLDSQMDTSVTHVWILTMRKSSAKCSSPGK